MSASAQRPPSLHELLLRSDFGRLNPGRVSELLDRVADPLTERPDREARDERR